MPEGFQKVDHTVIDIIKRRLEPACKREDRDAVLIGIKKMIDRYGWESVSPALTDLMSSSAWFAQVIAELMPEQAKQLLFSESFELVADVIEQAGLRLEDHFRVSDLGIAVTHEALKAIAATGYAHAKQFGGNDTLVGLGVDRSPFRHPLTEFYEHNGESYMNSWAAISLFINCAQGWGDEVGTPDKAKSILSDCLCRVAPTAHLDTMLRRARYDDRVLMQLTSYAQQGFEILSRNQLEK